MAAVNEVHDRITRYIDDAIAVEQGNLTGLKDMAAFATNPTDKALFEEHQVTTQTQSGRLEARLQALGGHHNALKDVVNKIGIAASGVMHVGKDAGDKATRHLVEEYAILSGEVAMYESLYYAATEAGDAETAALAKEIQAEDKAASEKFFARIGDNARAAVLAEAA